MRQTGLISSLTGERQRVARRGGAGALAVVTVVAVAAGALIPAAPAQADTSETVIVTATGALSPVGAVLSVGGTVLSQFHIIDGVEASVAPALVPVLAALPGIDVTPDAAVTVQSTTPVSTGPHTPSDAFLAETGADRLARRGDTGQGVTVAVVDTGIASLPDFTGRLTGGVDLSGGGDPFQDGYGHGTFVAGLIAGDGASSGGSYSGEAPGASLVSIKVAGPDGTTHLTTLVLALQWAVDHWRSLGIRVLNLSLGFRSGLPTSLDPLDLAVEAAWRAGITVVASAGNAGPFNGTILSPGDDPLVITVGALDDMATTHLGDDEMTDFSSAGPTSPDGWVKPDLVASGRSVVSLAAPGSTVEGAYPSARVGAANFAGSGTSFSTAIASGAAALVLARDPSLTPDQVKARLLGTAGPGPVGNPFVDGHGALNAYAAATAGDLDVSQPSTLALDTPGATIALSPDRPGDTWDPQRWSGLSWAPEPSNGWIWRGDDWNGDDWNGWAWNGTTWNGWAWNGAAWNSGGWTGRAWNGGGWNGSAWDGAAWAGQGWQGSAWK